MSYITSSFLFIDTFQLHRIRSVRMVTIVKRKSYPERLYSDSMNVICSSNSRFKSYRSLTLIFI